MKCVLCSGKTVHKKIELKELGKNLGYFEVDICSKCGEKYYSEEVMKKIQEKEMQLGIFGLSADTEVTSYGNSLAIRVKKTIADFIGLKKGVKVHVYPSDKKKITVEIID